MTEMSTLSIALAIVTAIASVMSVIGSAFILVCYTILPLDYHFRHVLILNLAASGGDQSQPVHQGAWKRNHVVLVCCAIWALPFFTGFLALGMGWYAPATGNWCWLKAKPVYLRYALTHGWRMLFIVIEICLYVYLDRHLRRHYRTLAAEMPSPDTRNGFTYTTLSEPQPTSAIQFDVENPSSTTDSVEVERTKIGEEGIPTQRQERSGIGTWSFSQITGLRRTRSFSADSRYQTIQRALLLNAYPLAYIILLLPGIANRLVEATGHSSVITQFMQATTQLVGLANALTYGWNERVAKQLKERFLSSR
ncbi:hypothetical protein F5887DRAFT_970296 [Amanita rubescens]|nr:hypothetical protein F5887DRAFT_970296 [Amanita rubescens]